MEPALPMKHTSTAYKCHNKIYQQKPLSSPAQWRKEGSGFSLTLDTKDFCPEELSVRQVDRKLHVSGKSEKKHEDGKGSYSYRTQEFRRVFDLPQGVNPEAVTCSMAGGKLYIQAPLQRQLTNVTIKMFMNLLT
uniref:SHSP domain-containing protein n=1 Tax=Cyprinus carpio carpio TaxID=630221 RepID=A0A8C0Y8G7_CYPCA